MDSPGSTRLPIHLQQPSSSSFSDPEVFTSTHNIRPGQTFVSVQTLTKQSFHIAVNAKTKVHDVLWKCGERLSLSEDKLFGLAFRQPTEGIGGDQPRHEYYFLDPAAKVMKYAHKLPRFPNWSSRSSDNRPILTLYFRVRVYIDQVGLLTCPKAREHYYLQLKENFLDHWAGRNSVSEERCWYMAALALITDKGHDYLGYFRAEQYFPLWVINERGLEYIRNNLPAACEDIINEGREKAMEKFMIEAGRSPFALNCHLYGLRRHKMDGYDNTVLGINARGIEMCDISESGDRIPLRSLQWNRVTRLSFDRKKLTIIGADGTKMSLHAQTESKAKYLLELCRAVHQTLLVMSHLYARMAPPPKPYQEMSVDGTSTSSTSGIGSGEHDKDSDSLSSTCGDRCHGSMSSKLRMRIKMDSNLDVKIEKMELEHIRQERAASQSSKASDESDRRTVATTTTTTTTASYHPANETDVITTQPAVNTTRPSSIDNASQTVDVNFNTRMNKMDESTQSYDLWHPMVGMTVLSTNTSPQGLMKQNHQSHLTRSETRIDNPDLWSTNNRNQEQGSGGSSGGVGRFQKKNSGGGRQPNAINRVHSMPSHYHVNSSYKTNQQSMINAYEEAQHQQHQQSYASSSPNVQAAFAPTHRLRQPPPYEQPAAFPSATEAAVGGQASFPPASATQFRDESLETIQNYPFLMKLLAEQQRTSSNAHQYQPQQQFYQQSTQNQLQMQALQLQYQQQPQQQQQQLKFQHYRRPSSCIDLTADSVVTVQNAMPNKPTVRADGSNIHLPPPPPYQQPTATIG